MAEAAAKVTSKAASPPTAKLQVWQWSGTTRSGGVLRKGRMEAANEASVRVRLSQMGIEPISVRRGFGSLDFKLKLGALTGGVATKDLLVFTRQFSVMIDAGLPLVQALENIGNQASNANFRRVLLTVKAKVESGSTFADALAEHPKVFDELFVQLVRAGEIGGMLDTILARLGTQIEKNEKLKRRVKGAMVYPSIVLSVGVGVCAILLAYVTPTFEKMFRDIGGTMPGPTQFLIDLSHSFRDSWYVFVAVPLVLFAAWATVLRTTQGRLKWDAFVLKLPVFGPVVRKVAVARFTRTLGTMLASGVPILDALEIVARAAGNKTVENAVLHVRSKISEGKTIAQPLEETKVFPPMVVQMIGVGEATGAMDTMLAKIADFYDDEVDVAIAALTSMIEPVMMVFLGGVVGGFLICMYLPIFSIAGSIK